MFGFYLFLLLLGYCYCSCHGHQFARGLPHWVLVAQVRRMARPTWPCIRCVLKNLATKRDLWLICRSCVVSVSDSSDAVDDIVALRCVVSFLACDHSYITTGDILLINLATTDDHTGGILLCAVLLYYSWTFSSSFGDQLYRMETTVDWGLEGICWYLPLANMLGDICQGPDGSGGGRMNYFLVVGPPWNIKIFPTKFVCAANIGRALIPSSFFLLLICFVPA